MIDTNKFWNIAKPGVEAGLIGICNEMLLPVTGSPATVQLAGLGFAGILAAKDKLMGDEIGYYNRIMEGNAIMQDLSESAVYGMEVGEATSIPSMMMESMENTNTVLEAGEVGIEAKQEATADQQPNDQAAEVETHIEETEEVAVANQQANAEQSDDTVRAHTEQTDINSQFQETAGEATNNKEVDENYFMDY